MKTKHLLILAAVGVGAYFAYQHFAPKTSAAKAATKTTTVAKKN